jgi:hypothetical protein
VNPATLQLSAPASVTANFTPPNPVIGTSITNKATNSGVTTMTLVLTNTGGSTANLVALTTLDASVLTGTGTVSIAAPTVPLSVGTIAQGASASVPVKVIITGTVTRFRLSIGGTMTNSSNSTLTFSGSSALVP